MALYLLEFFVLEIFMWFTAVEPEFICLDFLVELWYYVSVVFVHFGRCEFVYGYCW